MRFPRCQRLAIALVCALGLPACGSLSFTRPLSKDAKVDASKAYVYGSFRLDWQFSNKLDLALNSYPSIGLKFICDDTKTFVVGLTPFEADQILEVPSSNCSLKNVLFTLAVTGRVVEEQPYSGTSLQDVHFASGTMSYIGEYVGTVSETVAPSLFTHRWHLQDANPRSFDETTRRFLDARPALSQLKPVNAALKGSD